MTHAEALGRLSEYVEGDLASPEREACAAHLAECADCAEALHQLRETLRLLRALPDPPLPPRFAERVLARAAEQPRAPHPIRSRARHLSLPLAAGLAGLAVLASVAWLERGLRAPTERPLAARSPVVLEPGPLVPPGPPFFSPERAPSSGLEGATGFLAAADLDPPLPALDGELDRALADPVAFLERLAGLAEPERERALGRLVQRAASRGRSLRVAGALRGAEHPDAQAVALRFASAESRPPP